MHPSHPGRSGRLPESNVGGATGSGDKPMDRRPAPVQLQEQGKRQRQARQPRALGRYISVRLREARHADQPDRRAQPPTTHALVDSRLRLLTPRAD